MASRVGPQLVGRTSSFSATIKRSQDARQVLISMGFPKNRAEKALAATGGNDVQVAADWLLAHVFDTTLDNPTPREFVVYAIPGGTLGDQLDEFFEVSLNHCGRNGAHKSFPHVTLCQFFKVDDETVPRMCHLLHTCIEQALPSAPHKIKLQRYASASYMGLFLEEENAKWFRQLMGYFEMEMKKIGNYHRRNLNMPREVPRRLPGEFSKDSPITEMGQFQAQLTGAGLKQQGLSIHHVYCSPALRCVQTADAILEGLQADHSVSIKVENGLFEWLAWCQGELPTFMTVDEFHNFGLRVDTTYKSKVLVSDMNIKENCNEFYKRMYNITRLLLKEVPYCGLSMAQEDKTGGWELCNPPIPPLTHGPNVRFDWRLLLD